MERVIFGPGDWLVDHTSPRVRRAISVWLFILWLVPGLPIWILLRNSLWFVGFMSIFALWWTGMSTIGTETPVEIHEEKEVVE